MASKVIQMAFRTNKTAILSNIQKSARFSTSRQLLNATEAALPSQGLGAFRGGVFGFLAGSTLAGASVYYYILKEFRLSNETLKGDIYVRYCI
ncbi:hypothetical protein TMEN_4103 [Trichophyton mentagrophytes]|uniref:Zinc finger HIT domain-containing protein 1 n=4 Tax=Trichophyton TaxID=5550 RepID=A0A9P5D1P1_9EURO|nr:hypothetical protein TESG_02872 [Trichophyton tonsurans CBS 112818]EGE03501.1 hypothetical protein TEQG_02531 [Trichophyton equinum CBS 127.97]KAF3899249.1 Zinc finger HIT domain-containing protein 1 [Trichophyton interdigitale]KDB24081.1 hypothetical protein H109_04026 [Trichophyton interdigitale MR816]GBF61599.1 hypothetical protein TMEN_4103 [Trichophyton mentagrophytes]